MWVRREETEEGSAGVKVETNAALNCTGATEDVVEARLEMGMGGTAELTLDLPSPS